MPTVSPAQSLCLLQLSPLGHVCLTAAMVNAIKQRKSNISVTWIINQASYDLVKAINDIEFVVLDDENLSASRQTLKQTLSERRFDTLFVLQTDWRTHLLSRVIKAKKRVGYDKQRARLGHFLFINKRIAPRRQAHLFEGFMGFAEALGVSPLTKPSWDIKLKQADKEWAKTQLPERYAVISPNASNSEYEWLPERYAQICDYLDSLGISVILTGDDSLHTQQLAQDIMQCTSKVHANLVGKTSVLRLLAVFRYAELLVSPDSSAVHLATSQATPVVGLYAYNNPRYCGPYLSQMTLVSYHEKAVQQQFGQHWSQTAWNKPLHGKQLMAEIDVQEVKYMIQKVINNVL